jgi:hypothetical protein
MKTPINNPRQKKLAEALLILVALGEKATRMKNRVLPAESQVASSCVK